MKWNKNLKSDSRSASSSAGQSLLPGIGFVVLGLLFHTTAQASTYKIVEVLQGGGGFGASSFHDASNSDGDGNVMTGSILANVTENVIADYGTYDSSGLGTLAATGLQLDGGGSFTLAGTIAFNGAFGQLSGLGTLAVDFTGGLGDTADTTLGFNAGYVCCGSSLQDPNSFNVDLPSGDLIMTLWGANFTDGTTFDGSFPDSTLGMDLRLRLELVEGTNPPLETPLPAAAWLFGSALLGLGMVKRRKA